MSDLSAEVVTALADGRWRLIDGLAASLRVDRRLVEEAIEEARLAGHPIVGGNLGVRLSDNASEVRHYAKQRRQRAYSIARGTRALIHAANRLDGPQTRLWRSVA